MFLVKKRKLQKLVRQGLDEARNYSQPENIEDWININKLAAPCPAAAKWMVLGQHNIPNSVWIETGTHLGGATRFLAGLASKVITLEPSEFYFQQASKCRNDPWKLREKFRQNP